MTDSTSVAAEEALPEHGFAANRPHGPRTRDGHALAVNLEKRDGEVDWNAWIRSIEDQALDVARDSRPVVEGLREALRAWALQMAHAAAETARNETKPERREWHLGAEHIASGLLTWIGDNWPEAGPKHRYDHDGEHMWWLDGCPNPALQAGPAAVRPATEEPSDRLTAATAYGDVWLRVATVLAEPSPEYDEWLREGPATVRAMLTVLRSPIYESRAAVRPATEEHVCANHDESLDEAYRKGVAAARAAVRPVERETRETTNG